MVFGSLYLIFESPVSILVLGLPDEALFVGGGLVFADCLDYIPFVLRGFKGLA